MWQNQDLEPDLLTEEPKTSETLLQKLSYWAVPEVQRHHYAGIGDLTNSALFSFVRSVSETQLFRQAVFPIGNASNGRGDA
jgi:hypothetical protein